MYITCLSLQYKNLIVHLPYHPNNPTQREMRVLTDGLKSDLKENGLEFDRIIIAYSKGPSVGDLCKKHRLEGYINTK